MDDVPQLTARQGVDPYGGFIEKQHVGRLHQRAGEAQLLLHTARKPASQPVHEGGQPRQAHEMRPATLTRFVRHALQVGVEGEILGHGEVFVQAETLRHVADARLDGERVTHSIMTEHGHLALVRDQQPGGDAQERGLASAIRPHEACHRASRE